MLERRKNVASRYVRGQTQWEIARAFEVSQATISLDLKAIHAEWLESAVRDLDARKAMELAKVDEVERQAWVAWARSMENAETKREKVKIGADGETIKISKGQAGDPRFLDAVLKCVERRCKILGVEAGQPLPPGDGDGATVEDLKNLPPDELLRLHRKALGLEKEGGGG